jgi:hypothetical protein
MESAALLARIRHEPDLMTISFQRIGEITDMRFCSSKAKSLYQ